MKFIQSNKWLYGLLFAAAIICGAYIYSFLHRKSEPEAEFPSDKAIVLKDIKYGKDTLNYLDLYLPDNRNYKTPLLIIIHGGAWVGGDKSMFWTDMADDFYKEGICVANMNYRLTPRVKLKDMLIDIAAAYSFLQKNSKRYIINEKCHLLGTSAGGHLALLFAYTLGEKSTLTVTSFAGPTNFNDASFYQQTKLWGMPGLYKDLLGKDFVPDEKEMMDASPLYLIKNIPVLLIHASNDDVVPYNQSKQLADSLLKRKINHRLFTLPNGKHSPYGLNNSFKGAVNEEVVKWIKE